MGRVYEGRCPECGYHRELFLGGGMMSVNLELSSGVLPSHEQDMIREMRDRKEIAGFHVENYLTECPNCQEIMGNTMIEVTDQRGDRHVFGQHCGSCGKKLEIHRENAKAPLTCPKCREGIMVFDECGLWD